jgi:hypothetical protein
MVGGTDTLAGISRLKTGTLSVRLQLTNGAVLEKFQKFNVLQNKRTSLAYPPEKSKKSKKYQAP